MKYISTYFQITLQSEFHIYLSIFEIKFSESFQISTKVKYSHMVGWSVLKDIIVGHEIILSNALPTVY